MAKLESGHRNDLPMIMKKLEINDGENIHVAGRDIHIHQAQLQNEKISYQAVEEKYKYFEIPYRASVYHMVAVIAMAIIVFCGIIYLPTLFILIFSSRNFLRTHFVFSLLSITLVMLFLFTASAIVRLQRKQFVYVIWDIFLHLNNERVSLASYAGTCPVCEAVVKLEGSVIGWKGYKGKCMRNPDNHIFTFDHTSMTGHRILN